MERPTGSVGMYVFNSSVQLLFKIPRIFRFDGYRRLFYRVPVQGSSVAQTACIRRDFPWQLTYSGTVDMNAATLCAALCTVRRK